jgi:DNA helicase IV
VGLEFEHAIIAEYPGTTKADWYVALTRATKALTAQSASLTINPV